MFGFSSKKIDTNPVKIEDILVRGVEDIFIKEHLREALLSGKELRIKLGIDPTGPKIHLGRAIPLRKLKAFQDLGHKIVFIIGDFTAKIADPSDKLEKRPMLTDEDIKNNLKNYLTQVGRIIDVSKTEVHYNSKWLSDMNVLEVAKLLDCFTVQQMSKRRNFHERLEQGQDIFVMEFMYPALQGYDSVMVHSDVEIGGFDQLFNLKAGRTVQKRYGQKEQDIMALSMLSGTDGRKMSTSWGNVINITDEANDMYGKVMSIKDSLVYNYFVLCTELPKTEIDQIISDLEQKGNYREVKARLAKEIVRLYHGEKKAEKAEENFNTTFAHGGVPDDVIEVEVAKEIHLVDVLLSEQIVSSKTEFRRLVGEGAITTTTTKEKITDPDVKVQNDTYKIGKRRFIKIKVL